jgi:hypothetical protein
VGKEQVSAATLGSYIRGVVIPLVELPCGCSFTREIDPSAPSGGRRENFWGITCEKSRFYAKKSYFFPIAGGSANIFGVFRVKNHDFTPKKSYFFQF